MFPNLTVPLQLVHPKNTNTATTECYLPVIPLILTALLHLDLINVVHLTADIFIRYSDILLKNIDLIYNRLFCCNLTFYCVGIVSVTSVSRYVTSASRYQSR